MIFGLPWLALHGDAKTFFVGTFAYDSVLFPESVAEGIADGRLKLVVRTPHFDFDAHHEVSAIAGSTSTFTTSTGVATEAPEAVALSWSAVDATGFSVVGRTDRLVATVHAGPVDVAAGRQPISFGGGLFFTPMDLVNPFTPTAIDQEYKPGVDAVRVDAYAGVSGKVTAVAAYAGSWDLDGTVIAASGSATVGVTDVRLFAGEVHADEVGGIGTTTSVGPVELHGDATLTLPAEGGDPFARVAFGALGKPAAKWTILGEAYVQTNGAAAPDAYFLQLTDPRYARGELWALGRYYAAASVSWELSPLVTPSLGVIANVADPSALVSPALQWSVADEAVLSAGATLGVGARPAGVAPRSEFGTYPATGYMRLAAYF